MCSKSPKSSFCHPSAPIATISAPESITHNLQKKKGKLTKKLLLCAKKCQMFLMFPVIKKICEVIRWRLWDAKCFKFQRFKVIFKTLCNCRKPVRLFILSIIALLKVYLEFCIYDELKCVNILSPIFEPISGSSRKSRENFQIPFQQCEKKRGFLCKQFNISHTSRYVKIYLRVHHLLNS